MKIIKRGNSKKNFIVLKAHCYEKKTLTPGISVEREGSDIETSAFVERGLLAPEDLPPIGKYIVLSGFSLPGKNEKYSCNALEVIELMDEQALPLMIKGCVIPQDFFQWRPRNRRLKGQRKNGPH